MSLFDAHWLVDFLLGAVFVGLYAGARFDGPYANRSYTTFYRYCVATAYYVVGYLAAYYLIVASLSWGLRNITYGSASTLAHVLSTPAWIAVFTIALLPRLPGLSALHALFLQHARKIGGIPDEATKLCDAISAAKCSISEDRSREAHYNLVRRGLDLGNVRSLPDQTLHALIQHASELDHIIEYCQQDQQFARFMLDNDRPMHQLARRFDNLMFKASRGIQAIGSLNDLVDRTSGKSDNWEVLSSLVESQTYAGKSNVLDPAFSTSRMLINILRVDLRYFIADASFFLARIALCHGRSERARVKLLSQIGVTIEPVSQPRFRTLFTVFGVVLVGMFLATSVIGTYGISTLREYGVLLVMVPTFFVVALLCAIYPKQYFAFANADIYGKRPYLFFVAAGVAGAALSFVIGLVFRTLMYQSGEEALRKGVESTPWLLIPFTLAFVTAILVQDEPNAMNVQRRRLHSWRDAAVLGFSLGTAALLVQVLLPMTRVGFEPQPLSGIFVAAFGAFIGYYIPIRFRGAGGNQLATKPHVAALVHSAQTVSGD